MSDSHSVVIRPDGSLQAIYTDNIPFRELGQALGGGTCIRRASHVEPTEEGQWTADMGPSGGPVLGPYDSRAEALAAETEWLRRQVIGAGQ